MKNNIVGWFEIPVSDMERARRFYETVLDIKLTHNRMGELEMAWFPWVEDGLGATGSLVCQPDFYKPSQEGVVIYLTSPSGDLANELSRIEKAGGKTIQPKKLMTEEIGYMGLFIDTGGNRIAIHSRN